MTWKLAPGVVSVSMAYQLGVEFVLLLPLRLQVLGQAGNTLVGRLT